VSDPDEFRSGKLVGSMKKEKANDPRANDGRNHALDDDRDDTSGLVVEGRDVGLNGLCISDHRGHARSSARIAVSEVRTKEANACTTFAKLET
jgi:hypothetical protein